MDDGYDYIDEALCETLNGIWAEFDNTGCFNGLSTDEQNALYIQCEKVLYGTLLQRGIIE